MEGVINLLDLASKNGGPEVEAIVEEVTVAAPEYSVIPAVSGPGISYNILRRTELPNVEFVDVGDGVPASKSVWKKDVASMALLEGSLEIPEAILKADDGTTDLVGDEEVGMYQAAMIKLGTQTFEGKEADAKGFIGFRKNVEGVATREIDAGAGAGSSSAYLVQLGEQAVHYRLGLDGDFGLGEWIRQRITKTVNGKDRHYFAMVNGLCSYLGLVIPSESMVYRVKGISSGNTANYLTPKVAAQLLAKVPLLRRPGLRWFLNRDAAFSYQASLAATGQVDPKGFNPGFPEGLPTEIGGIPCTVTDSIPFVA